MKGKNRRQTVLAVVLMLSLIAGLFTMERKASAAWDELTLNQSAVIIKPGQTFNLTILDNPYDSSQVSTGYWQSSDYAVATVDQNGVVTANQLGTADITYTEYVYLSDGTQEELTASCLITVSDTNYSLDIHEKTLSNGEKFTLKIPSGACYTYDIEYGYDSIDVQQDEYTNQLQITAVAGGESKVVITFYDMNWNEIATDSCKITVLDKGIDTETMTRAVGKTGQIHVTGYMQSQIVSWTSSNPSVANVAQDGTVTAVAKGEADVTLVVTEIDGTRTTYVCKVYVSDPKLKKSSGNLAIGCEQQIEITGTLPDSEITMSSSNPSVAEVWEYSNTIYAGEKGNATISLVVDGVVLKYKVTVTNPQLNVEFIPIIKGKKARIKVAGTNSKSVITYSSSAPSVAKVSKNGYVSGNRYGSSCIEITADGKSFQVPVAVANRKVIGAIQYGMKVIGTPYSQAKRMQKGYYDCSSFAWRSYHSAGLDIGNHNWAPTAADMAYTLVKSKKAIAYKALSVDKLQPGDLLFFTKTDGTNNGRYKNIYHVAIYCGSYGNDSGTGLLLEARLDGIGMFQYWPSDRKVAVVARPTK
ncbi:MAG TPA: Ig-like domain-containing protein [Lachnospiraceae bacterium]|nr:Ig-like domain-containing protein [Lachnospiraceae bacterium]